MDQFRVTRKLRHCIVIFSQFIKKKKYEHRVLKKRLIP